MFIELISFNYCVGKWLPHYAKESMSRNLVLDVITVATNCIYGERMKVALASI